MDSLQMDPDGAPGRKRKNAVFNLDARTIRPADCQPGRRPDPDALHEVRRALAAESIDSLLFDLADGAQAALPIDRVPLTGEAKALLELAASIMRNGIRDPLLVRRLATGEWELISGHRRLAAAKLVGLTNVPAIEIVLASSQVPSAVFVANRHRQDFQPLDSAQLLGQVRDAAQAVAAERNAAPPTLGELAASVSVSKTLLCESLRIADTIPVLFPSGVPADVRAMSHSALLKLARIGLPTDVSPTPVTEDPRVVRLTRKIDRLSHAEIEIGIAQARAILNELRKKAGGSDN